MASIATLQGPSSQEWEQHREIISKLYMEMPLKKVQKTMESKHGFCANKRMYDRKLKQWRVSKYLRKDTKQNLIERLVKAANGCSMVPDEDVSTSDLSKVLRYVKAKKREESLEMGSSQCLSKSDARNSRPRYASSNISARDTTCSAESPDSVNIGDTPSSASNESSSSRQGLCTPQSSLEYGSNDGDFLLCPSGSSESTSSGLGNEMNKCSPTQSQLQMLPLSPAMRTDLKAMNMETILRNLQSYCQHLKHNNFMGEGANLDLSPKTREMWVDVKHGIYLIKVGSPLRAKSALEKAVAVMDAEIVCENIESVTELFSTLSPVNSKDCPDVRTRLLQHLNVKARKTLGYGHPLAAICHELQRDEQCREVSERALLFMLHMMTSLLGPYDPVVFRLQRSFISLMRRDHAYDVAERVARDLLAISNAYFGSGSSQSRMAAKELAHVLTDTGDYDEALLLCLSAAQRQTTTEVSGCCAPMFGEFHRDDRAIYAMEDIAEIHRRKGESEAQIIWLSQAAEIAFEIQHGFASIMHIVDGLMKLLTQAGRCEEAEFWASRKYDASGSSS